MTKYPRRVMEEEFLMFGLNIVQHIFRYYSKGDSYQNM